MGLTRSQFRAYLQSGTTEGLKAHAPSCENSQQTPFYRMSGEPLPLANIQRDGSCFIVLSGPSLAELDLSLLRRRGVFTLAVNNAATVVRPNAWTLVDPPGKFHEAIWRDPFVMKFVPRRWHSKPLRTRTEGGTFALMKRGNELLKVSDMPNVVGIERNAYFDPEAWLSEPSINWGNSGKYVKRNGQPKCLSVLFCALKLAYALGFRVVYLLGCDFNMSEERPYAFGEVKDAGAVRSNNHSYAVMEGMLAQLRPHFDSAGYHVFNCNPRSALTVFDHVAYREAIECATAHVPQDPLDAKGWYDKSR